MTEYLRSQDNGRFCYRGQTHIWPGPLIPSAYRRYRKTGAIYDRESHDYGNALRKVGRRFVGLVPINYFYETLALFYPSGLSIDLREASILQRLANDQYLARTLIDGPSAFEPLLTPLEQILFHDHLSYWKEVIDNDHRIQIRDMVFMRPFGYLLGHGLAQQYGFYSEMLDATSDPLVAAFFAAHRSPSFNETERKGLGVIYRFERPQPPTKPRDLGDYNFYNCPPWLDFQELLERFRTTEDAVSLRPKVEDFLVTCFRDKKQWRCWEAFRVSEQIVSATRVGRQAALLLVPDVIYIEQELNADEAEFIGGVAANAVTPNRIRTLLAVEDCSGREGTVAFYFRHGDPCDVCHEITRDYLWPNDVDSFFEMIGNALLLPVVQQTGQILPNRIDLLDPGYRI